MGERSLGLFFVCELILMILNFFEKKNRFERDEAAQYVEESHKLLTSGKTSGAV